MSRLRENILLAVTVILCVLLFCVKITGGIWHAVFGIMLVILGVGHTCKRFAKLRNKGKKIQIVDEIMLGALLVMFLTGMLMHPLQGVLLVKIIHKLSAVVFLLCVGGHALWHKAERKGAEKPKPEMERSTECFIKDC